MKKSTSGKLALRLAGAVTRFILNVIFYVLVVAAVYKGSTFLYHFSYEVFGSVARTEEPGTDVPVQIYRGETTMNIATKLETSLVIVDKYSFYVKTKLKNYDIMPGTYILNTSMDYDEILEIISDSKNSIAAEGSIESAKDGIGGTKTETEEEDKDSDKKEESDKTDDGEKKEDTEKGGAEGKRP